MTTFVRICRISVSQRDIRPRCCGEYKAECLILSLLRIAHINYDCFQVFLPRVVSEQIE